MLVFASIWVLIFFIAQAETALTDHEAFFATKIRPVLMDTCFKCHGGEKTNHGLRVDSRAALLKGGESGPAIVPSEPDKSLLIQAIRHTHDEIIMPPKKKLSPETVADFIAWVKQGAMWPATPTPGSSVPASHTTHHEPPHWAFEPIKRIEPPLKRNGWSDHPIDRFVLARLRENGMKPMDQADQRTLIRRVYFDLIGMPPPPDEVRTFVADNASDAYPKLVERLLASPHYGERWGRYWMDVVRYADTAGDNADYPIPEIRLYRDYIIASFNQDKPYDQFVQEQLAGDILAKQGPKENFAERVIATGFVALSRRYATAPFELMHLTVEDSIETTGRAFLGLTLRCARCHDHKYDPVTKEDYYAFYGFFASTQYPFAGSEEFASKNFDRSGFLPLAPPTEAEVKLKAHQQKIENLQAEIKRAEQDDPLTKRLTELKQQSDVKAKEVDALDAQKQNAEALKAELASLKKQRDEADAELKKKLKPLRDELRKLQRPGLPGDLPGAYAVCDAKPVDAYVHVRGNPDEKGPVINRRPPKFLAGDASLNIPDGASGRLQLAQWLTRPGNPLTPRVMVNRLWQHHFGKGIVATPSNFGLRGEAPTHPELLDYLASRFIESGWSIKAMHRLILFSKTYQLASAYDEANAAKDPGNRFYWRFDRRRLDAEAIRDSLLSVAGNLDLRRPGEHPFPAIGSWGWTQHNPFKSLYDSNHRSVYLMTQRFQRHPYLALFDGPDTNTSTDMRTASTVPLQALFMMNNKFVQDQAAALARRLIATTSDVNERIRLAAELVWSRQPNPMELAKAAEFIDYYRAGLSQAGAAPEQLEFEGWTSYSRVLLSANEFIYVD